MRTKAFLLEEKMDVIAQYVEGNIIAVRKAINNMS